MKDVVVYSFRTEADVDAVKRHRIAYSAKACIDNLIYIPEVKDRFKREIREGKSVQIEKRGSTIKSVYYDKDGKSPYTPEGDRGQETFDMVSEILKSSSIDSEHYKSLALIPLTTTLIGGIVGAFFGGGIGEITNILGTSINTTKVVVDGGIVGAEAGAAGGLLTDALIGIYYTVKGPLSRVGLAKKAQKAVEDSHS